MEKFRNYVKFIYLIVTLVLNCDSNAQTNHIGVGIDISHGTWSKLTVGQGIKIYYERILTENISAEIEAGGKGSAPIGTTVL